MAPTIITTTLAGGKPPSLLTVARAAATAAGSTATAVALSRRDLNPTHTQKVTLGIIAAYVVGIALLWNLPYVRWVLWPFKVRPLLPSTATSLVDT
jgi:hypothetical protein